MSQAVVFVYFISFFLVPTLSQRRLLPKITRVQKIQQGTNNKGKWKEARYRSMERRLGLRYTTLLINCHRQTNGDNAMCRSAVNLAFRRLQPKITRIQKIQQGKNNEGKWKEARY